MANRRHAAPGASCRCTRTSLCQHTAAHASAYVSIRGGGSETSLHSYTSAYVSIRQHTSAYVSIRQHTSAYVSIRQHTSARPRCTRQQSASYSLAHMSAYVSIRQHTSAYVSIRQHTSAYVSIRCTRPRVCIILASTYVSIRQHTSAYVSIRLDVYRPQRAQPASRLSKPLCY